MDEEKLIQVSFQIPPNALDSLSRLAEQLRMLTEAVNTRSAFIAGAPAAERGASDSFDPERFLALRQSADKQPGAAAAVVSDIEDAQAVSAAVFHAEDAESVSAEVRKQLQDADSAGDALLNRSESPVKAAAANDAQPIPSEIPDDSPPSARAAQKNPPDKIPPVRAEAETAIPDAPEARRDAEQQVPDAEGARAEAEARELALSAAQGNITGGIESPLGAGVVVHSQPDLPQSRWTGVTEELVVSGPAPLTAEAVSLAFERDGRRYDNGFPLY